MNRTDSSAEGATRLTAVRLRSRWESLVGIATGLSVIAGVAISVFQLVDYVDGAERAALGSRLQSLAHVQALLKADEQVRRVGRQWVREKLPALQAEAPRRIAAAGTGEDFYLAEDMKPFAEVHYHYEQLGALVMLRYIEFALVFEIIAFPDDYMRATESLRRQIAAHWKGPDQPLPDLGSNALALQACYLYARQCQPRPAVCPKDSALPAWVARAASANAGVALPASPTCPR